MKTKQNTKTKTKEKKTIPFSEWYERKKALEKDLLEKAVTDSGVGALLRAFEPLRQSNVSYFMEKALKGDLSAAFHIMSTVAGIQNYLKQFDDEIRRKVDATYPESLKGKP